MKYFLMILMILMIFTTCIVAEEARSLTLDEAIDMALRQNRLVKIMQYKIEASEYKLKEVKSNYFPRVKFEGTAGYNNDPAHISLQKGEYSHFIDNLFPLPPEDIKIYLGDNTFAKSNIGIYQPLTQIISINSERDIAKTNVDIAQTNLFRTKQDITYAIMEIYYGILILEKTREEDEYWVLYEEARYRDAYNAYEVGEILKVDLIGVKVEILDKKQELLKVCNQIDNLMYKLNQIIGISLPTKLVLNKPQFLPEDYESFDDYYSTAMFNNPQIKAAEETVKKAEFAVAAAKKEYIPDLDVFAQYYIQKGIPLMDEEYFVAGAKFTWDIFDFGQRKATVRQAMSLKAMAEEEYERVKESVITDIEKGYLDLRYAQELIQTALEVVELRKEQLVLTIERAEVGLELEDTVIKARAKLVEAEKDLLAAELNFRLIQANLEKIAGELVVDMEYQEDGKK